MCWAAHQAPRCHHSSRSPLRHAACLTRRAIRSALAQLATLCAIHVYGNLGRPVAITATAAAATGIAPEATCRNAGQARSGQALGQAAQAAPARQSCGCSFLMQHGMRRANRAHSRSSERAAATQVAVRPRAQAPLHFARRARQLPALRPLPLSGTVQAVLQARLRRMLNRPGAVPLVHSTHDRRTSNELYRRDLC